MAAAVPSPNTFFPGTRRQSNGGRFPRDQPPPPLPHPCRAVARTASRRVPRDDDDDTSPAHSSGAVRRAQNRLRISAKTDAPQNVPFPRPRHYEKLINYGLGTVFFAGKFFMRPPHEPHVYLMSYVRWRDGETRRNGTGRSVGGRRKETREWVPRINK